MNVVRVHLETFEYIDNSLPLAVYEKKQDWK